MEAWSSEANNVVVLEYYRHDSRYVCAIVMKRKSDAAYAKASEAPKLSYNF